jgi:hypothetical protein
MNRNISKVANKGYIWLLVLVLTLIAILSFVWPNMLTVAGSSPENDQDDIHDKYVAMKGDWLPLPKEVPKGQEKVLVPDRTTAKYGEEGKLVEHISTGTNDFYIAARYAGGTWLLYPGDIELTDANGNSYNKSKFYNENNHNHRGFLLEALDEVERELKMKIPKQVAEKMNEGYKIGVAASNVQNYVAGPRWEKMDNLTMDELFNPKEKLEYKFEDEYLYIKCYPKIHIREDYYYQFAIDGFSHNNMPIAEKRYGVNSHNMYELTGKPLGSTSAIMWDERLLRQGANEAALKKEVDRANGATWIHFSQIRSAKGYLDGYQGKEEPPNSKKPFEFYVWPGTISPEGNDDYEVCWSDKTKIGATDESFKTGNGVSIWFAYPLELTFYLASMEDLAVQAIEFGDLTPGSTAAATVRVLNLGLKDKENIPLVFSIPGITKQSKTVGIPAGMLTDPDDPDSSWEPGMEEFIFSFAVPERGIIEMTAEINPEPRAFEEVTYDNNKLTVTAMVGDYGDLASWIYSREIVFSLPSASATLSKPGNAWWVNSASGTLNVHNDSTDLYQTTEFIADNRLGNPSAITVRGSNGFVSHSALIRATLHREDFGESPLNGPFMRDDPLHGEYADNGSLFRTGRISTSGSIDQKYNYRYYCSNDKCRGHLGSDDGWGGAFNDVQYSKVYMADVYNGQEIIDPPEFKNEIDSPPTSFKRTMWWTSHPYTLKAIRLMYNQHEDGSLSPGQPPSTSNSDGIKVNGQYERVFTNQNKADIEWQIAQYHSMAEEYKNDRDKAISRIYNLDGSEKVAFASDLKYKNEPYPFRSGYYFNPSGTYSFTLKSEIYKDSPNRTPEHVRLVNDFIASFRYESNMTYITNDRYKDAVRINGDSVAKSGTTYPAGAAYVSVGNTLFNISITNQTKTVAGHLFSIDVMMDYNLDNVEELRHNYVEVGANAITDSRFKKILEGYAESNTQNSSAEYKYVEFVKDGQHIYKITETTTVTFTVNPTNKKVYTHAQMKNGDYKVQVYMSDVNVRGVTEKNEPQQTGVEYPRGLTVVNGNLPDRHDEMLDEIEVSVIGSMYDDIK